MARVLNTRVVIAPFLWSKDPVAEEVKCEDGGELVDCLLKILRQGLSRGRGR